MRHEITQCVREMNAQGGVSGVAYNLDKQFHALNCECHRFTLQDLGSLSLRPNSTGGALRKKIRIVFEVIWYTVVGSAIARRMCRNTNGVVICHSDIVCGDIYVNHGLHRSWLLGLAFTDRLAKILLNPLHVFLLAREWLRFRMKIHRRVVCFCKSDADALIRVYPNTKGRVSIIPNGVDIQEFRPNADERRLLRRDLRISDSDFVLIFIGHEFVRKGLQVALEALAFLPGNVKLLVAGGRADIFYKNFVRKVNRSKYEDRVQFLGTRSDIRALLNAADALILPSVSEAWPLVGMEALACGTPVLMTAVGGITEYLRDGINGFFIERDAEDIACKTRRLMDDPAGLERMRNCARDTAMQYSWKAVAAEYLKLIDQILDERNKDALSRNG